jgi:hypothetical protein
MTQEITLTSSQAFKAGDSYCAQDRLNAAPRRFGGFLGRVPNGCSYLHRRYFRRVPP